MKKQNFFTLFIKKLFIYFFKNIIEEMIVEKLKKETDLQIKSWNEGFESLSDQVSGLEKKLTPVQIQEIIDPLLYTSPSGKVKIRRIKSPHRDQLFFELSHPLYNDGPQGFAFIFPDKKISTKSFGLQSDVTEQIATIRDALYAINGITEVTIKPYELHITKTAAIAWETFNPKLYETITGFLEPTEPVAVN